MITFFNGIAPYGMMKRFTSIIIAATLTTCLAVQGHAETFLAPGDTGTIEYPLQNRSISDAALQDATLEYEAPAHFIVNAASIRGPHGLPPAETFSFIVEYEIAAGAPEGSFEVTLKPRSPSSSDEVVEVAPPLASLDTSVKLKSSQSPFVVVNGKGEIFKIRFMNGVKCGVDPGRAATLRALSKGVALLRSDWGDDAVTAVGTALFSALGAHVAAGGFREAVA